MKAWVYRKEKSESNGSHLFLEEVPVPRPGPNQVLLKVQKVSVCGTDETLFRGDLQKVPDGIIPGHEFYGEIVDLGSNVQGLSAGQGVAGESHYAIPGAIEQGIIGLWGAEIRKGEMLPPLNGAYAEYLCIPAECAHPVPKELVSDRFWPSLFEAVGNDYFLIKKVQEIPGTETLGLFGSGPHGLFAQVFARHFGIPRIMAFETDPTRLQFAQKLQIAHEIRNPTENLTDSVRGFTNSKGFDVSIDIVGKQGKAFESCCETTRDGGTIFLFGLYSDQFFIQGIPGNDIIFEMKSFPYPYKNKTLNIVGITGREGIWEELIDIVCSRTDLQDLLMKPVQVLGNLNRLGEDTKSLKAGSLKRAYHSFTA